MATMLKKITIKDLVGNVGEKLTSGAIAYGDELFKIAGACDTAVLKDSTYGDYYLLNGDFVAKTKDGEFESSKAILTKEIGDMIADKLTKSENGYCEFSFSCFVAKASEKASKPYTFVFTPIRKANAQTRVSALLGHFKEDEPAPIVEGDSEKGDVK